MQGVKGPRFGESGPEEKPVPVKDPRGRTRYWLAPVAANAEDGEDTDFAAGDAGYVSITPLQTDLTRHSARRDVQDWLDAFA